MARYCSHCGNEVFEEAVVCVKCGCALNLDSRPAKKPVPQPRVDEPDSMINFLSFFVPLIGLFAYVLWEDKYPIKAKAAGRWSLISFAIIMIILSVVLFFTFIENI